MMLGGDLHGTDPTSFRYGIVNHHDVEPIIYRLAPLIQENFSTNVEIIPDAMVGHGDEERLKRELNVNALSLINATKFWRDHADVLKAARFWREHSYINEDQDLEDGIVSNHGEEGDDSKLDDGMSEETDGVEGCVVIEIDDWEDDDEMLFASDESEGDDDGEDKDPMLNKGEGSDAEDEDRLFNDD
ncbi:hypothetical protein HDV00_003335 [Rhizophlyctis rosea]|nr:hypothetical protein HDV00_003335 [Rhizophlyctis rosea]